MGPDGLPLAACRLRNLWKEFLAGWRVGHHIGMKLEPLCDHCLGNLHAYELNGTVLWLCLECLVG